MAKRDLKTNLEHAARILGKKGGKKRDEELSTARKRKIAAMGGRAKAKKD